VQFTKEPFPVVTAQADGRAWQVTFMAQQRAWRGQGEPPACWLWLQLARAVGGSSLPPPWQMRRRDAASFSLENSVTGERLTGFLSP
jgi:hypothetical protein